MNLTIGYRKGGRFAVDFRNFQITASGSAGMEEL